MKRTKPRRSGGRRGKRRRAHGRGCLIAILIAVAGLAAVACEENVTEVFVDDPGATGDTVFVTDTLYVACTPHHFDPETVTCDEGEEHEHEYDHDHDHHHGRGQGHDRHGHGGDDRGRT